MKKNMIATAPLVVALAFAQALAQDPSAADPGAESGAPRAQAHLIDSVKRYLQHVGATVDQSKSTADMVVSNYADPKGGERRP